MHVTDGDTAKLAIKINNKIVKFTFRLNGIDTPETRKGETKEFGKYVKEVLTSLVLGKILKVKAYKFDKYGRVLADIYAYSQKDK